MSFTLLEEYGMMKKINHSCKDEWGFHIGFNWKLIYNWHDLPAREIARRKQKTDPVRTPAMVGCVFAINKRYFETLGTYDRGMFIWGGENLELSFKLWMCGGELLTTPCSHDGHIFRNYIPYPWPSFTDVIWNNTYRLAEVWLDDYKNYYYERRLLPGDSPTCGDVSDRKALREKLKCHSFEWYLTNIYPEQYRPGESIFYGEIRNRNDSSKCLESNEDSTEKPIVSSACSGKGGTQYWMMSKSNEIRREEICFAYAGAMTALGQKDSIQTSKCSNNGQLSVNQKWEMTNEGQLKHESGFCIELSANGIDVSMGKCDKENLRQLWKCKKREK
jgi:polypeptide N-acetylgalactosaminyltransferase